MINVVIAVDEKTSKIFTRNSRKKLMDLSIKNFQPSRRPVEENQKI